MQLISLKNEDTPWFTKHRSQNMTIYCKMDPKHHVYPSFNDLPLKKDGPPGNAWGLWGSDDQIGTLNHLTDPVVARAAQEEIRTGTRVSLKYVRY